MNSKVIKNFSWAFAGRLFAAFFQTVGIILLARWESIANFGVIVSVLALAALLQASIDFGFSTYLIKERAHDKNSDKIYSCIKLNAVIANSFSLVAGLVLILLGFYVDSLYLYLIPLAPWIAYERRADQLLGLFIADGNNKKATQLLTQRRFTALIVFVILFLLLDIQPTLSYTLGMLLGALFSYFHTYNLLKKEIQSSQLYSFRSLFKYTLPYWINSLFAQLRNIDATIVTAVAGPIHGAYFGFVNRSIAPLNMIATSMASVILPSVSKNEIKTNHFLKYLIFTTLLASIPYLTLYFLADWLIPLAIGDQYIPTIELFKIICIGLIFFSASSILGSILQGIHLQKQVASVNIISTATYLILLTPLTYYGNSLYATYTLFAFFIFRFVAMYYHLHRHLFFQGHINVQ